MLTVYLTGMVLMWIFGWYLTFTSDDASEYGGAVEIFFAGLTWPAVGIAALIAVALK